MMVYLNDVKNGDDENMPDGRIPVFVSNENGGFVFESFEFDAHLSDDDADGEEVEDEFGGEGDAVGENDVFVVEDEKFVSEVEVTSEREEEVEAEHPHHSDDYGLGD